ncbi:MAG: response regulator transcription factor [Bacteroidetes bacterium]|nr:response regulator transcription factor [Bacteroidota bacterium]
MSLRCYIVDNEDHAISLLTKHINKTPGLELVGSDTNPLEALEKITSGSIKADVCFLDIEMPQLSGLELAALIQRDTHVIFTTAHEQFALKAFDTDVIDYLLKPFEYPRFLKAIQKVQKLVADAPNTGERTFIFIQSETKGKLIKVLFENIFFIEGAQNYLRIMLDDGGHLTYLSLKEMEDILPKTMFMRIHKSYIINLDKVSSVEGGMVHLNNEAAIQLGSTYKKDFLERINDFLIRSNRLP